MTRVFKRTVATREQNKKFVIVTEGNVTEPEYFDKFKRRGIAIKIPRKQTNSSPKDVLRVLRKSLKEHPLDENDEAWMVIDRDDWPIEQINFVLDELRKINTRSNGSCFLAMTNPKIEFWLLLHFEDGNGVGTPAECDLRLQRYLPEYDKHVVNCGVGPENAQNAIKRAKKLDVDECEWPKKKGSTLYRLVNKLLPEDKQV